MKFYYILLKSPEIQVKHVIIAAEAKESEPIKKISSSAQARGTIYCKRHYPCELLVLLFRYFSASIFCLLSLL
jgi:hypothetical protein